MGNNLRNCIAESNGVWPKQLIGSGVMFWKGERITLEAFRKEAKLLGYKFKVSD